MVGLGDKRFISIADCGTCKQIPDKISADLEHGEESKIPPETSKLAVVVEFDDPDTDPYCTSTTRLLKCGSCGTYYYYNHYDDDGQHFMDPTFDQVAIRRYSPTAAMDFLERIVGISRSTIPSATGQLVKAFAEGTTPQAPGMQVNGYQDGINAAWREIAELHNRFDALILDLKADILSRDLSPDVKKYIIDALCTHFLSRQEQATVTKVLLNHKDPAVRTETTLYILGFATEDAPVVDIIHVPREARAALKTLLTRTTYIRGLAKILLDVALTGSRTNDEPESVSNVGSHERSLRAKALYGLVVAAQHVDLTAFIPSLITLLGKDKWVNYDTCWVLKTILKQRKNCAQRILDELDQLDATIKKRISRDPEVEKLVAECKKKLHRE